ncbi:uncharacterized protein VP01_1770g5 [Puccinia sorghi]|uniref:Uncharacterized protein n=1 Tax=Puccinia sorghi TaxID=27349 RepID=A0A0L6VEW5_9BASI|nr:uncharacterized protein VP01_1770g5 [Puccinia sorghi]
MQLRKRTARAKTGDLDRFLALHSRFVNPGQLFKDLIEVPGYSDVKVVWNLSWQNFTQEKTTLVSLKKNLNLNDKDHSDKIHTLIRCAHFVRFPGCDDSNLTNEQILAKLNGSAILVGNTKLGGAKTELDRFLALHSVFKNPEQLFNDLINVPGLSKTTEYINNLYSVFESLKLHDNLDVATLWNSHWQHFAQGKTSLDGLKVYLNLNDKDHSDKIHTLIRCAHFVRFPESDYSNLTNEQILAKLNGSATQVGDTKLGDPEIKWATKIVQKGFHAKYQRGDLIVAPTLGALSEFAKEWNPSKHKAPYTSIIGPTMTGKTRLLKELAQYVPVVYVCLRPPQSTGQPPRSGLASEFLPSESNRDMNKYYLCLLAAIFKTVDTFFKEQTKSSALREPLTTWFEYSFQIDNTPQVKFDTSVQKGMEKIQSNHQTCQPGDYQKLKSLLLEAVQKMNSSIGLGRDKPLTLLLAIDEARNFLVPKDQIKGISYFRLLRQALACVPKKQGFFSVFTNTSLQVANFSPSMDRDPILRLPNKGHGLFSPLYKISTLDLNIPPAPTSWATQGDEKFVEGVG